MKVITISGAARHGKDTFANYLKEQIEDSGKKVLIIHYADYLKCLGTNVFYWDGKKDEKGRSLLQMIGDVGRENNPNFFIDIVISTIKVFENKIDYILIPDARFENEIYEPRKHWDTISFHITREGFDNGLTEEQKNHVSECSIDSIKFDHYVKTEQNSLDSVKLAAIKAKDII